MMNYDFGCQGSIPVRAKTMKYGGNGACMELRVENRKELL